MFIGWLPGEVGGQSEEHGVAYRVIKGRLVQYHLLSVNAVIK